MSENPLRFLLIGCGRISPNHLKALAAMGTGARLVAVCDIVPERAIKAAEAFAALTGYMPEISDDYKSVLQNHPVDVCVIATESGFHGEIALYCLKKDKHVLVEKPMALNTRDAEQIVAEARSRGLTLGVCHQNRFNPPVAEMKAALDAGRFGKLIHGTARILWNRTMPYYSQAPWRGTWAQDGGTLMNQCIHNIDLLQWMMGGEPETVFALTGNYIREIEAEDFGAALVRFKNGSVGLIEGTACVYPKNLEETLSVFGEKGTAVIGGLAVNRMETWDFAEPDKQDERVVALSGENPKNVYGSGHTPLYRNFIEAVRSGEPPLIDGEEGIKAMKIVLAAYKSQKTGLPVYFDSLSFGTMNMTPEDVRVRGKGL